MARKTARKKQAPEVTDAGRAEIEKFQPGAEVKREFEEAAKLGREPREQVLEEINQREPRSDSTTAGDPDAAEQPSDGGTETPSGDNPTPDQNVVEEIGRAEGLTYQNDEPLKPTEKVAERDRKRWELDPASSEHYRERMEHEGDTEE
jgi:hypothetical protein